MSRAPGSTGRSPRRRPSGPRARTVCSGPSRTSTVSPSPRVIDRKPPRRGRSGTKGGLAGPQRWRPPGSCRPRQRQPRAAPRSRHWTVWRGPSWATSIAAQPPGRGRNPAVPGGRQRTPRASHRGRRSPPSAGTAPRAPGHARGRRPDGGPAKPLPPRAERARPPARARTRPPRRRGSWSSFGGPAPPDRSKASADGRPTDPHRAIGVFEGVEGRARGGRRQRTAQELERGRPERTGQGRAGIRSRRLGKTTVADRQAGAGQGTDGRHVLEGSSALRGVEQDLEVLGRA